MMTDGNAGQAESKAGQGAGAGGPPKRYRLATAGGVRRELASVYAQFRRGEITGDEAKASTYILRTVGEMIRLDEVEARLNALEATKK